MPEVAAGLGECHNVSTWWWLFSRTCSSSCGGHLGCEHVTRWIASGHANQLGLTVEGKCRHKNFNGVIFILFFFFNKFLQLIDLLFCFCSSKALTDALYGDCGCNSNFTLSAALLPSNVLNLTQCPAVLVPVVATKCKNRKWEVHKLDIFIVAPFILPPNTPQSAQPLRYYH